MVLHWRVFYGSVEDFSEEDPSKIKTFFFIFSTPKNSHRFNRGMILY